MQAFFVIPGDIEQPTGGYGYDRQVLSHSEAVGLNLVHCAIPGGYPFPDAGVLAKTLRIIARLPRDSVLLIDGLAYGAMPAELIREFAPRRVVELCHHPLALEPGLAADVEDRLRTSERQAMALAAAVIVTGPLTKRIVAQEYGVASAQITVALPGTVSAPRAQGSGTGPLRILSVGSVIPRKGYADLVEAMALLAGLDWKLDIIGSKTHAPETVEAVERLIQERGLGDRIFLHGAQPADRIAQAYEAADLFVMSSHFEGYGMVIAEAMARGLPIVTTAAGAVADTLDPRAGVQVPVGEIQVLAKEIREMLVNAGKRSTFSDGSWAAGQALPGWHETAATIRSVLEKVSA